MNPCMSVDLSKTVVVVVAPSLRFAFIKLETALTNTVAVFGIRTLRYCMVAFAAVEAGSWQSLQLLLLLLMLMLTRSLPLVVCLANAAQRFRHYMVNSRLCEDVLVSLERLVWIEAFVRCRVCVKVEGLILVVPFAAL